MVTFIIYESVVMLQVFLTLVKRDHIAAAARRVFM